MTGDADVLSAELAPGLGEILASGTRGTPWRLEAHKASSAVTATAFANFSRAYLPPGAEELRAGNGAVYAPPSNVGGGGGGTAVAPAPPATGVHLRVVDYSRQPMSGEGGGGGENRAGCQSGRCSDTTTGTAPRFCTHTPHTHISGASFWAHAWTPLPALPLPCPSAASAEVREGVARRLLAVAAVLESEFGAAQVTRACVGCVHLCPAQRMEHGAEARSMHCGLPARVGQRAGATSYCAADPACYSSLCQAPHPNPPALQDVEGCFVGNQLYVVQTRPQP